MHAVYLPMHLISGHLAITKYIDASYVPKLQAATQNACLS